MNQPIVPAEPSSLVLFLTGVASIAFFMWITGQWKEVFGHHRAPANLIQVGKYAVCEYEKRFIASLDRLREYGFGEHGFPSHSNSAS